jgi:hypothetical protein
MRSPTVLALGGAGRLFLDEKSHMLTPLSVVATLSLDDSASEVHDRESNTESKEICPAQHWGRTNKVEMLRLLGGLEYHLGFLTCMASSNYSVVGVSISRRRVKDDTSVSAPPGRNQGVSTGTGVGL